MDVIRLLLFVATAECNISIVHYFNDYETNDKSLNSKKGSKLNSLYSSNYMQLK